MTTFVSAARWSFIVATLVTLGAQTARAADYYIWECRRTGWQYTGLAGRTVSDVNSQLATLRRSNPGTVFEYTTNRNSPPARSCNGTSGGGNGSSGGNGEGGGGNPPGANQCWYAVGPGFSDSYVGRDSSTAVSNMRSLILRGYNISYVEDRCGSGGRLPPSQDMYPKPPKPAEWYAVSNNSQVSVGSDMNQARNRAVALNGNCHTYTRITDRSRQNGDVSVPEPACTGNWKFAIYIPTNFQNNGQTYRAGTYTVGPFADRLTASSRMANWVTSHRGSNITRNPYCALCR